MGIINFYINLKKLNIKYYLAIYVYIYIIL